MSACTLICRNCGYMYDLPDSKEHQPCPACSTENCRPQAEGEALDKLQRATRLRLDGEYDEALRSYNFVLMDYEDEHEALWGKLQCEYGVEFVTDPRSGERKATVHRPHSRPMQLQSDFRRACELAPEEIRTQYEAEAAYVDAAQAEINRLKESAPPFDVFICHKTTPLTGGGYTEDYNRAAKLFVNLQSAGYRVFFAPFANLEPGASYEAGIYHALSTAKVMLLISSDAAFLTSPWVKSEWTRYLEMLDDGADKHLIPLMYGSLSDARMPKEIRLRGLQNIRMEDFDAAEKLMAALARYTGKGKAVPQPMAQVVQPKPVQPEPQPVATQTVQTKPVPAPAAKPTPAYAPESHFETIAVKGGVAITGYNGPGGEVLIPPMIGGKKVVTIKDKAFLNCSSLTGVTIPEGVTSIGVAAFEDCSSLTSVSLPASLSFLTDTSFCRCRALTTISVADGNEKYYVRDNVLMSRDNALICYPAGLPASSYAIPEGVTSIGNWAFCSCHSLTSMSIPEGVTNIGDTAFFDCVRMMNVSIPESVTHIGDWAFSGCTSMTSVSIPKNVRSIGNWAFYRCRSLTIVNVPANVTLISDGAFGACPNLTLRVHPNTPAHTYAQKNSLRFELISSAPEVAPTRPAAPAQPKPAYTPEHHFTTKAVDGGVAITKYTGSGGEVLIPPTVGGKKVVEIGKEAFKEQQALTKVIIPESVTSIGNSAFSNCSRMTSVRIPAGMTSIGSWAFHGCSSLTSVNIPEGVTSIGWDAFHGCSNLTHVHIPASVLNLDGNSFSRCSGLKTISVAAANKMYYIQGSVLFSRKNELVCYPAGSTASHYVIPESVTSIGASAFNGCNSLTSVSIPEGVTSIGQSAFDGCSSLTSINIPEGVRSITDYAFSRCERLMSVSIPASVTSIGDLAFLGCRNLKSVSLPEGLTRIGKWAFSFCSNLTSVSIPEGVTSIGDNPFDRCPNLTLRVHPNSPAHTYAQKNSLRFELVSSAPVVPPTRLAAGLAQSKPAYTPEHHFTTKAVAGGVAITGYTGSGSEVLIPPTVGGEKVVKIGEKAFEKQKTLTKVVIPESVTIIEDWAFTGCISLIDMVIPEGTTRIGNSAFSGCSRLTSLIIPESVAHIGFWAFYGCNNLTLRVHPNTPAHTYAQKNSLRFELVSSAPEVPPTRPAAPVQPKPVPKPVQPTPAYTPERDFSTTPPPSGFAISTYNGAAAKVIIPPTIGGKRVTEVGAEAFRANTRLEEVVLPEGVTRIGYGAFRECTDLRHVALPASLTAIDGNAFQGCRSLQAIALPGALTEIQQYTFNGCTSLKEVAVPAKVVRIGLSAFDYCTSLTSVTLPAGLREIGNMAFYRCFLLSRINLPDGVKLGKDVFGQCKRLPASITRRSSTSFAGFIDKILPF